MEDLIHKTVRLSGSGKDFTPTSAVVEAIDFQVGWIKFKGDPRWYPLSRFSSSETNRAGQVDTDSQPVGG